MGQTQDAGGLGESLHIADEWLDARVVLLHHAQLLLVLRHRLTTLPPATQHNTSQYINNHQT
jgi:hypothetical protein